MIDALEQLRPPVLLAAALTTGLQAGTYYTWSSGVMPGLARTDDRTFVHAMQQMNIAIVNPVFLATFLGAPALALVAVASTSGSARPWVIAGAGLAVATVAITAAGNIPLNNALDAAGPINQISDLAAVREAFESRWVRLNIVRSLTSTVSLGCLVWAALRR
jgi:uncharacterized membrane protein